MKVREPKDTDQLEIQKAVGLLVEFINQQDIEPSLWIGAMIAVLANNFADNDIPYKYFKKEMKVIVEHYKY